VLQLGFAARTQPVQVATGSATLDLGPLALKPAAQNLGEVVVMARKPLLEQKPVTVAKWWTMNNSLTLTYQQLSFPNPLDSHRILTRSKTYVNVSSDNTFTLGRGWSVRAYGLYNSPSIYGLLDWAAYSYASLGVKKTFLAKRASLNLTVADLFYQLNFLETTNIKPVAYASRLHNNTRCVKLAFTFSFGKTDFKSKRVETNTNATERGRLGI